MMARVRAARVPTRREPTSPGVWVTAMASMLSRVSPASLRAFLITGLMASMWLRAAISGITPPYSAWISICDTTTLDKTFCPSSMIAAAVSSQEDSIPRIFILTIITQILCFPKCLWYNLA